MLMLATYKRNDDDRPLDVPRHG